MAWTTPKTDWETGELVAASDMNEIGENLAALQHPATAVYTTTDDIDSNSINWVDVDSNNLSFNVTTNGGDVLAHFQGAVLRIRANHDAFFDLAIDGVRQGSANGIISDHLTHVRTQMGFTYMVTNLSAGSHTFAFQWKRQHSNGIRLKAGAQFWVREIKDALRSQSRKEERYAQ